MCVRCWIGDVCGALHVCRIFSLVPIPDGCAPHATALPPNTTLTPLLTCSALAPTINQPTNHQAYTVKKRLESYMRRLVSSANAISAVGPGFYAARFRRAMKKVFLSQGGASAAPP